MKMPSVERINEIAAKYEGEPANADPSSEVSGAPQPDGTSGEGSASAGAAGAPPADASAVAGEQGTSPAEATTNAAPPIDHELLQAKLEADRARREAKEERRRIRAEAEQAKKDREAAAAEKAKWETIGKKGSYLEALKAAGLDPKQTYDEMTKEALTAGTPEAQIAALKRANEEQSRAYTEQLEALKAEMRAEREAREEIEKRAQAHSAQSKFETRFKETVADARFSGLRDEYEDGELFGLVHALKDNPELLVAQAEALQVPLTTNDGTFNMLDILNVMQAKQNAHRERMQRRNQTAAPQSGQPNPSANSATAKRPTVNGTAERNAGNTIGNDLAAQRATEAETLKNMSFQQRRDFLARKYGG